MGVTALTVIEDTLAQFDATERTVRGGLQAPFKHLSNACRGFLEHVMPRRLPAQDPFGVPQPLCLPTELTVGHVEQ